jgi:hypothetical protein
MDECFDEPREIHRHGRQVPGNLHTYAAPPERLAQTVQHGPDQIFRCAESGREPDGTCFQARHIEQVADEVIQPFSLGHRVLNEVTSCLIVKARRFLPLDFFSM